MRKKTMRAGEPPAAWQKPERKKIRRQKPAPLNFNFQPGQTEQQKSSTQAPFRLIPGLENTCSAVFRVWCPTLLTLPTAMAGGKGQVGYRINRAKGALRHGADHPPGQGAAVDPQGLGAAGLGHQRGDGAVFGAILDLMRLNLLFTCGTDHPCDGVLGCADAAPPVSQEKCTIGASSD